ncbi:Regulator of nonsense transcripts upf2 [Homalodisca vitripennis]|nr:Regulator of nonsense transcripts upf2 [Homalodisca vitripennis]
MVHIDGIEDRAIDSDLDSDDNSDNQAPNSRCHSPDDDDFLAAFDKMVSDNLQDRMRDNVKPQFVDIPVPLHVKTNAKKTYEQLQEPETEQKETVNFVLMLRKGNKQQYKNVAVPTDSELALNLRSQEKLLIFNENLSSLFVDNVIRVVSKKYPTLTLLCGNGNLVPFKVLSSTSHYLIPTLLPLPETLLKFTLRNG